MPEQRAIGGGAKCNEAARESVKIYRTVSRPPLALRRRLFGHRPRSLTSWRRLRVCRRARSEQSALPEWAVNECAAGVSPCVHQSIGGGKNEASGVLRRPQEREQRSGHDEPEKASGGFFAEQSAKGDYGRFTEIVCDHRCRP